MLKNHYFNVVKTLKIKVLESVECSNFFNLKWIEPVSHLKNNPGCQDLNFKGLGPSTYSIDFRRSRLACNSVHLQIEKPKKPPLDYAQHLDFTEIQNGGWIFFGLFDKK